MPPKRGKKAHAKKKQTAAKKTTARKRPAKMCAKKDIKVIKKQLAADRKKQHAGNNFAKWNDAVRKAKEELDFKGFVPIGGTTPKGTALLKAARLIYGTSKKKQQSGYMFEEARDAFRSCEIEPLVKESINHLELHAECANSFSDQAAANSIAVGKILADIVPTVQCFFTRKTDCMNRDGQAREAQTPPKKRKSANVDGGSTQKEVKRPAKHANGERTLLDEECDSNSGNSIGSTRRNYAETLRSLARAVDEVRTSATDEVTFSQQKTHEALQTKIQEQEQIIADLELRCKELEARVTQTAGNTVQQLCTQLRQFSDAQAERVIAFQDHLRNRGKGDMVSEAWRMIEEERQLEMAELLERMQRQATNESSSRQQIQQATQALRADAQKLASRSKSTMHELSEDVIRRYEGFAQGISKSMLRSKNQVVSLVSEIETQASRIGTRLEEATDLLESVTAHQAQISQMFAKHADTAAKTKTIFNEVWQGAMKSYLQIPNWYQS